MCIEAYEDANEANNKETPKPAKSLSNLVLSQKKQMSQIEPELEATMYSFNAPRSMFEMWSQVL